MLCAVIQSVIMLIVMAPISTWKTWLLKINFWPDHIFAQKIFELKGLFEMEQHVFELSYIIEGATEEMCKFHTTI